MFLNIFDLPQHRNIQSIKIFLEDITTSDTQDGNLMGHRRILPKNFLKYVDSHHLWVVHREIDITDSERKIVLC